MHNQHHHFKKLQWTHQVTYNILILFSHLATSKFQFISIHCVILFYFYNKRTVTKMHLQWLTSKLTKHHLNPLPPTPHHHLRMFTCVYYYFKLVITFYFIKLIWWKVGAISQWVPHFLFKGEMKLKKISLFISCHKWKKHFKMILSKRKQWSFLTTMDNLKKLAKPFFEVVTNPFLSWLSKVRGIRFYTCSWGTW